ncbi:MAG: hypothetical protein KBC42_02485 [Candidatus Pacebacteria bacterium]|nr:hypothetical protein [Candidatus Paceibacterota bacterium]MBP9780769.1 hypothetical protein [Candidatus Paceibacterota bacterium]
MGKRQKLRDEKFAELVLSKESYQFASQLDPVDKEIDSRKEQIQRLTEATRELYKLTRGSQIPLGAQSGFAGD